MAEGFALAAGVLSLATFSQTTLLLVLDIARSQTRVLSLREEIVILQSILKDCGEIVDSEASVPNTVQGALGLCHLKQLALLETLEKIMPATRDSRFRRIIKPFMIAIEEPRVMAAYDSFRSTVLMLRDLTSDSTMALLLSEGGLASDMMGRHSDRDGHDPSDRDQLTVMKGLEFSTNGRQKRNELYMDFVSLMQFDFTRDLILIIEVAGGEGLDKFEFVPLRNKVDTASDENFISRKVLEKYKMDMGKLVQIPEEDRRQRTLEGIGGYFTPEQETKLRWHKLNDRKQRQGTFIVMDDPPFDVLIGSKQFANECRPSAMYGFGRYMSKAKRKDQDDEHRQRRKDAENEVKAQLAEAKKMNERRSV
ncbi:hypothetical protein E0Z10_g46 [Xylaria hypoxylon]|uniref:Fungal N-terminal domain-containing protein n=1 Tax=Xylaria hypoxylon TaxID=37992 RepID=A0A4Z0ZA13_9PEZI|nr:hypothetical protein E0Z10_g46 [Xylaria hypoxylon]